MLLFWWWWCFCCCYLWYNRFIVGYLFKELQLPGLVVSCKSTNNLECSHQLLVWEKPQQSIVTGSVVVQLIVSNCLCAESSQSFTSLECPRMGEQELSENIELCPPHWAFSHSIFSPILHWLRNPLPPRSTCDMWLCWVHCYPSE